MEIITLIILLKWNEGKDLIFDRFTFGLLYFGLQINRLVTCNPLGRVDVG